jgi:hypothetical protein
VSSCPEGTVLTGLNYMKGKTDPVALADDEYPEWLWQCLDVMKKEGGDSATDDAAAEFCTFYFPTPSSPCRRRSYSNPSRTKI